MEHNDYKKLKKLIIDHPDDNEWTNYYCIKVIKEWERMRFSYDRKGILKAKNDLLTVYQSIGGTRLDEVGWKDMFDFVMRWYELNKNKKINATNRR